MQRGGAPDDSDLKKPSLFNKWKKEVKEEKEEPKKNWWTFYDTDNVQKDTAHDVWGKRRGGVERGRKEGDKIRTHI